MFKGNIKIGQVEGTGSAINVELGFLPDYVKLVNVDDAGSKAPSIEWWNGMAAAAGLKGLGVVDNGVTGDASQAIIGSNGVSQYNGVAASGSYGFTIGADADVNASGETIHYIAIANSN